MVLLRCVDEGEAGMLMKEIHEGSFGTHANGHAMARKILRAGYYWLTMESNCYEYMKSVTSVRSMQTRFMYHQHLSNISSPYGPFRYGEST